MATPQLRVRHLQGVSKLEAVERPQGLLRRQATRRLLAAERSEQIYSILLEEIIALGFRRALLAMVDFESGELAAVTALNCSKKYQQRFRVSLYAADNPIVRVLCAGHAGVIAGAALGRKPLYCHPLIYGSRNVCREAEHDRSPDCLAAENFHRRRRLQLQEQTCTTCEMRGYAGVVLVDLRSTTNEKQIGEIGALIDVANHYLARSVKTEHYYDRMTAMETTIRQMETVMRSMADPVILTDANHRVIMQNNAAERFFKVPEQVSEGRIRAVELNNLLFSAALSSLAVSGSDTTRDLTLVDAIEGEEMLFEAVCAPTYARDGLRVGMVTVMRDVTDLRRADEEVRANLEKLRAAEDVVRQDRDRLNVIIENVGDPIVVSDGAAKVVLLDPLAQELFGPGKEGEKEGKRNPIRVRNQAKLDTYLTGFTFSFSDRESGPLRLVHPATRAEIEYDARSGKVYDERGQVAFTVTVLRDFTAVRKLEQLKLERRMLEVEKFAATGRLAGTIAHEINNPMEAIKNAIFLLADKVQSDGVPVYDILKSETERVARIVRQMLGLYRSAHQVGPVDINSLVEDTLLLFSRQLEQRGIRVQSHLGKLPPAVGSADQLRQVLSNLVVNAQDSMSKGGGLIIRTRHLPAPDGIHGWVRILVADTGAGIPESILHSIFEPFVTTKGEKGTGLGLWIVKGIVENHAGRIRVRSRVGHGTVFRLDLPVVR
jgi:signal transduction histidine kinase